MRTIARLTLVGLVLVSGACASPGGNLAPSQTTTTLMIGWEHWFTLDWTVEPGTGGARRIRGYVTSRLDQYAEPVQLLAQALDGSGALVGQRIAWVPSGVPGQAHVYFEITDVPPGDHYRVSVWAYSILESHLRVEDQAP